MHSEGGKTLQECFSMSLKTRKLKVSTFQIIFQLPAVTYFSRRNESSMKCKLTIFIRWKISGCIYHSWNLISYHVALECALCMKELIPFLAFICQLKVSWQRFNLDFGIRWISEYLCFVIGEHFKEHISRFHSRKFFCNFVASWRARNYEYVI